MGGMKPSHHTNLIAEWEWRTMADSSDTRYIYVREWVRSSLVPRPLQVFNISDEDRGKAWVQG